MKEMSTIRLAMWNIRKVAGQKFIFAKSEASKESSKSVDRFFHPNGVRISTRWQLDRGHTGRGMAQAASCS